MTKKNSNNDVIQATSAYPGEKLVRVRIPLLSESDGDVLSR